jgi:DNA-binding response OmpR family regulator
LLFPYGPLTGLAGGDRKAYFERLESAFPFVYVYGWIAYEVLRYPVGSGAFSYCSVRIHAEGNLKKEQFYMPGTILVIDDDEKLNRLLKRFLSEYGYEVYAAVCAEEGFKKIRTVIPDLIILDVMLPGMTGFDVCKRIRQFSTVPIIMLTARGEVMDKVVGLELGADDYLPKPFEPRELVARMQAVLRRSFQRAGGPRRSFGHLTIDFHRRQVWLDNREVGLTTSEFTALELLVRHAGKVLDRDEIMQALRGIDSQCFNRVVDVTMSRLRQKLADDPKRPQFVKTVWGTGYTFVAQETVDESPSR